MIPVKNYYQFLGVDNFVPLTTVTKAYRKLALQYHPDRGGDSEKMKTLNAIYDVLKKEKANYDQWLQQQLYPVPAVKMIVSFGSSTTGGSWTYTYGNW